MASNPIAYPKSRGRERAEQGLGRRPFQALWLLDIDLGLLKLLLLCDLDKWFNQRRQFLNLGELLQVLLVLARFVVEQFPVVHEVVQTQQREQQRLLL